MDCADRLRNADCGLRNHEGEQPRAVPNSREPIPHSAFRIPHSLKLLRNEPVARYTSFRVGGPAEYLARPANAAELREALAWAGDAGLPVTVIGGGSNLLVGDRGVRGLVIVYHNEREPIEAVEEGDTIRVSAPAQVGL